MPVSSESLHGEELTTINLGKAGGALPAGSRQENRHSQDCQKSPPLYRSLLQPDSHRLTNDRKLLGWQVSDTVFFVCLLSTTQACSMVAVSVSRWLAVGEETNLRAVDL